eukprot:m.894422 g.894422  ORF g.894422 m.894422 type:complete len:495 (+) comp59987_c0_seq3:229-1713(+)
MQQESGHSGEEDDFIVVTPTQPHSASHRTSVSSFSFENPPSSPQAARVSAAQFFKGPRISSSRVKWIILVTSLLAMLQVLLSSHYLMLSKTRPPEKSPGLRREGSEGHTNRATAVTVAPSTETRQPPQSSIQVQRMPDAADKDRFQHPIEFESPEKRPDESKREPNAIQNELQPPKASARKSPAAKVDQPVLQEPDEVQEHEQEQDDPDAAYQKEKEDPNEGDADVPEETDPKDSMIPANHSAAALQSHEQVFFKYPTLTDADRRLSPWTQNLNLPSTQERIRTVTEMLRQESLFQAGPQVIRPTEPETKVIVQDILAAEHHINISKTAEFVQTRCFSREHITTAYIYRQPAKVSEDAVTIRAEMTTTSNIRADHFACLMFDERSKMSITGFFLLLSTRQLLCDLQVVMFAHVGRPAVLLGHLSFSIRYFSCRAFLTLASALHLHLQAGRRPAGAAQIRLHCQQSEYRAAHWFGEVVRRVVTATLDTTLDFRSR